MAADHAELSRPTGRAKLIAADGARVERFAAKGVDRPADEVERFLSFVPKVGKNECAIWQGPYLRTRNAHVAKHGRKQREPQARFSLRGGRRLVYVSRYAWALVHGPIPKGKMVYKTCFTSACCNVRHMWLGTIKDRAKYIRDSGILEAKHARQVGNGFRQREVRPLEERILAALAELKAKHMKRYRALVKMIRPDSSLRRRAISRA